MTLPQNYATKRVKPRKLFSPLLTSPRYLDEVVGGSGGSLWGAEIIGTWSLGLIC